MQPESPAEAVEIDVRSTVRGPDSQLRGRLQQPLKKKSVKQTVKEPLPKLWWRLQLPPT
jgi:hypothetical protein